MDLGFIIIAVQGFLATNLIYGIFFLIAYKGVSNFYPWITYEFDGVFLFFASIIAFYFCGMSYYVATFVYEKTNWFFARLLILVYIIILITLMIVFGHLLMDVI